MYALKCTKPSKKNFLFGAWNVRNYFSYVGRTNSKTENSFSLPAIFLHMPRLRNMAIWPIFSHILALLRAEHQWTIRVYFKTVFSLWSEKCYTKYLSSMCICNIWGKQDHLLKGENNIWREHCYKGKISFMNLQLDGTI